MHQIHFRVGEQDWEVICEIAEEESIPVSTWIRQIVRVAIRQRGGTRAFPIAQTGAKGSSPFRRPESAT